MRSCAWIALTSAALGLNGAAIGQSGPTDPAHYPSQTSFPHEDAKAVARHLSAARRLAEPDLMPEFFWRCLTSPLDKPAVFAIQHNGLVPATRVFDQLWSVGQNGVSAFALDTSGGIILIDALDTPDEARDIIVPNLRKLGLDPARLRYVIVTHGHGDHYGGAKYLQDNFGARVVASAPDWAMMANPGRGPFAGLVPPKQDIVAKDGDAVTLGGTTVRMYITPGHTPGTLSLIFPVTDHGTRYVVGLMGGTGGGQDGASARQQVASLEHWAALTKAAGVDALVTNHPTHMAANEKMALLRYAIPGDANPFVYGTARYQRFVGVQEECSKVQLARMGESFE